MSESNPQFSDRLTTALFIFICALTSAHFAMIFCRVGADSVNMHDYIAGKLDTPYQWRCLMMPVFQFLLDALTPERMAHLPRLTPPFLKDPIRLSFFLVNSVSMFIAMLAHTAAAQALFKDLAQARLSTFVFTTTAYLVFILNPNLPYILPYDIPALAFGGLGAWLVLSGRYLGACLLLPLAVLNRETAFMSPLLLLCLLLRGHVDKRAWPYLVVMGVIWIAMKLLVAQMFSHNADASEFKLTHNLLTLVKPWQWPALLPLLALALLSIRAAFLPGRVNAAGMATGLAFTALLVVAAIAETRAFGDLIQLSALCMTHLLLTQLRVTAREAIHA